MSKLLTLLPVSPPRASTFFVPLIVFSIVIVIYELLHLASVAPEIIRFTIGFALVFIVIFAAFRNGLWPALLIATLSNLYIIYALGGPGRHIVPLSNMLRGEWLLLLLFFTPAIVIGYLRDLVNKLIQRERQARDQVEEERLQLIKTLEHMPVGVVIAKAPTGELTFSNSYLEQLSGHPIPNHEKLNDYPGNVLIDEHGNPLPQARWPITRVLNHENLVNEEYLYALPSGEKRTLQIKGAPIYNNNNQIISGVVIVDDITSEKESLQRKDDFVSMVSHELKTPITSLKVYTQLLLRTINNPDDTQAKTLRKIDEQANKLHQIINNMLDIAKVTTSSQSAKPQTINLDAIIQDVVQDLQATYPDRALSIKGLTPGTITGDRDQLSQVLINIINNAIKYSPPVSEIFIQSQIQSGSIVVSVQDFGIGISVKDQERIFERFYQAQNGSETSSPGLGVGLYLSTEIIKLHGGKIWVESRKGQGSTFYISLPLTKSTTKSASKQRQSPATTAE